MGYISDGFVNLSDFLQSTHQQKTPLAEGVKRGSDAQLLIHYLLKPWLPSQLRLTSGYIFDGKNRALGPFDVVGASDLCPPVGEGAASYYPADGAVFALGVRDWTQHDLSLFGKSVSSLKQLERKPSSPIFCGAITFKALSLSELSDFLKGPEGKDVDAVLSIGHQLIVRNSRGLYGNTSSVELVSEQGSGESLKAFAFLLLKMTTSFLNLPFLMNDYQHL